MSHPRRKRWTKTQAPANHGGAVTQYVSPDGRFMVDNNDVRPADVPAPLWGPWSLYEADPESDYQVDGQGWRELERPEPDAMGETRLGFMTPETARKAADRIVYDEGRG